MRDEKKKIPSRRRRSSGSLAEDDEDEYVSTRTPASTPFPYPDYGDDEDEDDDDDVNLLEVIIDTLTGTTFQVRVSPWETGAGLKGLLHRTQGIASSDQHILLGQQELLDDIPLIDQGVQDGANLRLVLAMKGGPINTGRPPQEDALWREFADYMDVNREELWDGAPAGKPVTLLVLKEGENVNLYRVVENQDGTFSPLNESWGSNTSISGKTDVASKQKPQSDELLHQQRMIDLNNQMEALKLRKKDRRKTKNPSRVSSPRVSVPATSRARRVRYNMSQSQKITREPPSFNPSVKKISKSAGIPNDINFKKSTVPSPRIPLSVPPSAPPLPTRFLPTRSSRPTTQETTLDVRRPSISRGSKVLDEIPHSLPPKHVDFSSYKKLDSIKGQSKRNSLGPLTEDDNQSAHVKGSKIEEMKNYDVYRKTLVKHGKEQKRPSELQISSQSREAWSGRDVPLPLYMERPRKERTSNRLYQSHNQGSLRPPKYFDDRPKTSPEVLERRQGSATDSSTMSERIQLRGPDDKLRELITILNTSRANSRLSQRSTPPYLFPKSNKIFASKTRKSSGKTSLSVSLASLSGFTPPGTPELNALLSSDSTTQRDFLRELAKAQGIGRRPSSKRSTPEGSKRNSRRPGSGVGSTFKIVSTPRGFIPVTPKKKKKNLPKCNQCKKRIGVSTTYPCRCGQLFCAQHRYSEAHECTYDYKTAGRKLLELANPLVVPPKLPKI